MHRLTELQLKPAVFTRPASLVPGDPRISRRADGRKAKLLSVRAVGAESVPAETKRNQATQIESWRLP